MEINKKINHWPSNTRKRILEASQKSLWSPKGAEALSYLRDKRKLSDYVIKKFGFGCCPRSDGPVQVDPISINLQGRLIMPVFDTRGDLIALTTRDPKAEKRFQHWHEDFEKSNVLFGLNVAKNSIIKSGYAIIVEGQFDTTYAHSSGIPQVVGILGSALSFYQLVILRRYTKKIYLAFDPDDAGNKARERTMKIVKDYGMAAGTDGIKVFNVRLDSDPDEYIMKKGKGGFIRQMLASEGLVRDIPEEVMF